jgi:hypothetical protein
VATVRFFEVEVLMNSSLFEVVKASEDISFIGPSHAKRRNIITKHKVIFML